MARGQAVGPQPPRRHGDALTEGPVSTEVAIGLPNGLTVYATITRDGATALGLKVGVPAAAVFKAPSVIIGVAA
jgi:molybdate transport system regulatory protein